MKLTERLKSEALGGDVLVNLHNEAVCIRGQLYAVEDDHIVIKYNYPAWCYTAIPLQSILSISY